MNVFDLQATIKLDTTQYLQALRNIQQNARNISSTISSVTNAIGSMQQQLSSGTQSLNGLVTNTTTNMNGLHVSLGGLGGAFSSAGSGVASFGDMLKANIIGDLVVKGIETVISTVKQLGDTAVHAVTDFTKASVGVGMSFDSAMSQVAATMGMTTDDMQNQVGEVDLAWGHFTGNLRDFAKEMGKNTAFSATQAAEALNYMALAGYDAQTSMQMLPTVLNLAASGGMELANASDMITDTQTALGLSIERTTQLVDQMAKTASSSNTSVAQLGSAMLTVGGNAKSLQGGMIQLEDGTTATYDGITELNAALGILADNGTKASEGGTALRNILSALSSDKFKKTFDEMGVSAYNSEGKMRSLKDIFADMNVAMTGMTDQQRTSIIQDVFNERDKKNVLAFLDTSMDRWDDLTSKIMDAEGAANAMANTQLDNLNGALTIFKSALEGAQIALSDRLSPELAKFVKLGTDQLSGITQAFESGGFVGALDKVVDYIGQWKNLFTTELSSIMDSDEFGETFQKLGDIISSAIYESVQKIPEKIGFISELIEKGLNFATENMRGAANIGVKIIEKIAEGITSLSDSGAFGEFVSVFSESFGKIVTSLAENAAVIAPKLMEFVTILFTNLASFIETTAPTVLPALLDTASIIFDSLITNLVSIADTGLNLADSVLPKVLDFAVKLVESIGNAIAENAPTLIPKAVEIIMNLAKSLVDNIPTLIDTALILVESLADGVLKAIPVLIEKLPAIIDSLLDGILESVPSIIQTVIKVIEMLTKEMPTIMDVLIKSLPEIITSVLDAIGENLPLIVDSVLTLVTSLLDNLPEIISTIVAAIPELVAAILLALTDAQPKIIQAGFDLITVLFDKGDDIFKKIVEIVPKLIEKISKKFMESYDDVQKLGMEIFEHIKTGFFEVIDGAKKWGKDMIDNFIKGITDTWNNLKEKVSGVAQGIADFLGFSEPDKGPLSNFHTYAPDMMKLFASGIEDNQNIIGNALNKALGFGLEFDGSELGKSASAALENVKNSVSGAVEIPVEASVNGSGNSPKNNVTINELSINVDANFEDEEQIETFVDRIIPMINERLEVLEIRQRRAIGGSGL